MKNISFYKLLLISSLINISLYADNCSMNSDNEIKKESLDLYNKSEEFYSDSKYDKAYFDLTKSYELYSTENPKLTIYSTCIHIKPGPFGAVRSRYTKKDDYTFNRKDLGKNIGKFIPPRTLVVIEVYEDTDKLVKFDNKNTNLKSKTTVFNVLKTKENKNQSVQMPLDTFSLTINGEKQTFELIESEKNKSVEYESITNINDNITIQSSEKFDHTIASY